MKIFCLLAALFLILGVAAPLCAAELINETERVSIEASTTSAISLKFNASDFETQVIANNGEEPESFLFADEGLLYHEGMPPLPAVTRFVVVPHDRGLELEFEAPEVHEIELQNRPAVCEEDWAVVTFYNGEDYREGLFPPMAVEMSEPIVIRGVRLVKVTTYPMQYDPEHNTITYRPYIQTHINYTGDEPVNPARVPIRRNRSRNFLKYIDALAINGDIVGRDDPDRDREPEYIGHYLVATHENCLQYAVPFIEWRRKSGYKMDILVIPSNQGRNPGWIQNQIRDRYEAYLDDGVDPFDQLLLIGDRAHYYYSQGAQWVLEPHRGNPTWGNDSHADYLFACLEGNNDHHPDVGYSRWHNGNANLMQLAVNKTLAYEANPHMEDTDWLTRGGVYSQHWGNAAFRAWHITIHTNVRWGEEVLEYLGFDEIHFYERYQYDRMGQVIGPEIRDWLNDGLNVMIGRAENYYWRNNFQGVNRNVVFPINLCHSGHGEWCAESMTRTGSGNDLKGPVAMTYGWGNPPYTMPNNAVWVDMVNAHLLQDMTFGWARVYSITKPETYFGNRNYVLNWKTESDGYGDPGIQYWKGVPRVVEAEFPDEITTDSRSVDVFVTDTENDSPVDGAQVTLYFPGDMPDADDDDYADYDDMIMKTMRSNSEGHAIFVFEDDIDLDRGDMFVTVTGRDIKPFFGEMEINANMAAVHLQGYAFAEVEGNENDEINPGETIALSLTAENLSAGDAVEGVTAVVSSLSPWVEVEENEVNFGDVDANGSAEGEEEVTIHVSPACPDGESRPITRPKLSVVFTAGDESWESFIELNPSAPHFVISRIIGDEVIDVGREDLDIEIRNIGSQSSSPISGQLNTLGMGVSVIGRDANYPRLDAGDRARIQGDDFGVSGNQIAIPGSKNPMMLILTNADDFVDTVYFELQVGEPRRNAPQGPDEYGYICFDDTDDDWDIAPDYEWLEISARERDRDYDGEECDFDGETEYDIGEAQVVDLGFETQFYGELYDQITIGSNGFICFGAQPRITNFSNWPMENGVGGGMGMAAPFWDDLRLNNNSGVYFFHDEDEGRFIVEWYEMRHASGNADLNFQIILYDHDVWVTETGDQNIKFQYRDIANVQNVRQGDQAWTHNAPFASVGISSPDGTTGLGYTWNGEYPVTSAPLEDGRALLYATSPRFRSGTITGRVYDAETGEPVPESVVFTEHGFMVIVDEEGNFTINDALAETPFNITASMPGYNDSTYTDLELAEDDTLNLEFGLLHPEFELSVDALSDALGIDQASEQNFDLTNTGNGTLEWRVERTLRGDANADPWEIRRQYSIGEATDDSRIQGAVFVNGIFYVAGANDHNPTIYTFDEEGELIEEFAQPGDDRYGFRDLAWDGEWIWGSGDNTVYALTPECEVARQFEGPYNPNNNMAWDTDREVMWISSTTSDISSIDREGNVISELDRMDFRIYGLAYYAEDPDGYPLYIFHRDRDIADQIIHKMNPENNDTMLVTTLEPAGGGTPIGAYITNQFDVYSYVFLAVTNRGSDDRIDVWQIDARRDWMLVEPTEGVTNAGESQEFTLTLDATGLPEVRFQGDLIFYHNAVDERAEVPITLDVLGAAQPRVLDLTGGWNMVSLNVTPEDLDIVNMMQPIVESGHLQLMKDGWGRFYLPEHGFCNIPQWEISDGYQMMVTEDVEFEVTGEVIPPDEPIALEEGWNLKAYYPLNPVNAVAALAGIVDELEIAKDGWGNFYLPAFDFSNMGDMEPGQGYQFKVTEDVELVYRFNQMAASTVYNSRKPEHFKPVASTGSNMSLLLLGSESMAGYEAGVYSQPGVLIGAGCFDASGSCGVALWGDNRATDRIENITEGEAFETVIWDGEKEFDAIIEPVKGELRWKADDFAAGKLIDVSTPVEFGVRDAFPNPANGPITIVYGVEEAAKVTVKIYDLHGRIAGVITNGVKNAGYHQITWNTDLVSSGLYLIELSSNGEVKTAKVLVMK